MKWIAKRILLLSREYSDKALIRIFIPFIEEVKKSKYILGWYCSKKTDHDGSKPSVRIYLNIYNEYETIILKILDNMLNRKKDEIGWTGQYDIPDPCCPNPNRPNLKKIEMGCDIGLSLLKKYPNSKRLEDIEFFKELVGKIQKLQNELDNKAIHFIANILSIKESVIYKVLNSENIQKLK